MKKLIEQLYRHEGFKSNYYRCTANKLTIGCGRCVDTNPFSYVENIILGRVNFDKKPLTKIESDFLLFNDINNVTDMLLNNDVITSKLNDARLAVVINMVFNLGFYGFLKFRKTRAAIYDCFYEKAAREMLDSKWANQVGKRAIELAEQMRTGEWQ